MSAMLDLWRWPHFLPHEVLSPHGLSALDRGILLVQPLLLNKLEEFRAELGFPILVNHENLMYRGYRSPEENYKIVKGETYSYHMQGLAADCTCPVLLCSDFRDRAIRAGFMGVGFYPSKNFCHLDVRTRLTNTPALWQES